MELNKFNLMKKLISIIALLSIITATKGQVCDPYNPSVAGAKSYILPDSATGIAHACAGKPYEQIMNIKVFKDTAVFGITATVDSVVINLELATIGLPSNFTIVSVPAMLPPNSINNFKHITLKGDSVACIKISGMAAATPSSTNLTIPFKIKAKIGGFIDTTVTADNTNYTYVVDAIGTGNCWAASVKDVNAKILNIVAYPNPASEVLNLQIDAISTEKVNVEIKNAFGQLISKQEATLQNGRNFLPVIVASLPKGVYTYTVHNGALRLTNKWVKE